MDVNPPLCFLRLAIRFARVIDPTRVITVITTIDQSATFQAKEKGMVRIVGVETKSLIRLLLADALATVLNNPGTCRNFSCSEDPIAMNA